MATLTAAKTNLQRLALVRLVAVTALLGALLYAYGWLRAELHYGALLATVLALVAANVFTFWRLGRPWPVTDAEFAAQLLLDIAIFSVLFYLSGGATNPFVSYYLVPLSIAAAVLPWRHAAVLALLCIGLYSLLLFHYQPLPLFQPQGDHHHGEPLSAAIGINPHIAGMWFNFALSAALITSVVVRMASTLREQQAELNRRREQALHGEQLLAVATLAAGTAHELGTPLSTMTVLLEEMESDDPQLHADIALLRQQVASCRSTLKQLVSTAEAHQRGRFAPRPADAVLRETLTRWRVMRPQARYELAVQAGSAPLLRSDAALEQAIINLLDNGMDAGGPLQLTLGWRDDGIELRIRDRGPGIALDIAEQLGKPFVTSKGKGLGLGLFLSSATAERCGGEIHLFNHAEGGTEAVLRLPAARSENA
jgi:two-component system sensor histidine kinase RegB